jgi:hypothetical protein
MPLLLDRTASIMLEENTRILMCYLVAMVMNGANDGRIRLVRLDKLKD